MANRLSSDTLEAQFGPVTIAILSQTDQHRIIATRMVATGQVLEYTEVSFDPAGIAAYPQVHQQIRAGTMMGKAFRAAGVDFVRETRSTDRQATLTPEQAKLFGVTATSLGTQVKLDVFVGPHHTHYAHLIELYSPVVTWPDMLSTASQ